MAKREGSSASGPRTRSKAAEEGREAREAEIAQRLDKLPQELWEKILDHLEENDLFPLALSCRCFRQKQKELVAQAMENVPESGKPRLALKTTLRREPEKNPPVSAEYLRFCWNEKVMKNSLNIMCLAAYHGYMPLLQEPLLQEFLAGTEWPNPEITEAVYTGQKLASIRLLLLESGVFRAACRGGSLEIIKWLRSKGCPWDPDSDYAACQGGHLETLMWLRSEGCPITE